MKILTYPNPLLRIVSENVKSLSKEDVNIITQMRAIVAKKALGLAANQVGVLRRYFVMLKPEIINNPPKSKKKLQVEDTIVLINPNIISFSNNSIYINEGCLSCPDIYAMIDRFDSVTVRFFDLSLNENIITVNDLAAAVVQHELDHLNAILFLDHMQFSLKKLYYQKLAKRRNKNVKI